VQVTKAWRMAVPFESLLLETDTRHLDRWRTQPTPRCLRIVRCPIDRSARTRNGGQWWPPFL